MGVATVAQSAVGITGHLQQKQAWSKVLWVVQGGRENWHCRVQITATSRRQDARCFSCRGVEGLSRQRADGARLASADASRAGLEQSNVLKSRKARVQLELLVSWTG
jgi:hypothetical protein